MDDIQAGWCTAFVDYGFSMLLPLTNRQVTDIERHSKQLTYHQAVLED